VPFYLLYSISQLKTNNCFRRTFISWQS